MSAVIEETKKDPIKEFQNNVIAKMRGEIRGLLPDDVLQELMVKAVNSNFFEKRSIVEGSGYHQKTIEKPSWFEEAVHDLAKPLLEEHVRKFMEDNKEKIDESLKDLLEPNMLTLILIQNLGVHTSNALMDLTQNVNERFRLLGTNR